MDNNNNQDNAMHALPVFPEELHLNRAWCLFVRRKRSNIRSMDAHSIAEALQERRMGLSLASTAGLGFVRVNDDEIQREIR